MTKTSFVDLETGPENPERLAMLKPQFEAAKNLRDPEKIKSSIAEKEADWISSAALNAVTGQILCVGWLDQGGFDLITETEQEMLVTLWARTRESLESGGRVVGFCSTGFDWPFAIRRSFLHGVRVPICVRPGRYFNEQLIDVAERWACGGREPRDRISLDTLSKFLGTGAKLGEGKDFAALWASDRPAAIEYLKRDLELTKLAYERLFT